MVSKILTVAIREDVEKRLRRMAGTTYGQRKGYLSTALTEAAEDWIKKRERGDVITKVREYLRTGFKMGEFKFKTRAELHER